MTTYGHMDYLTKSFSYARHPGEILPTGRKIFYVEGDTTPYTHYDRAWKLRCGGTLNMSKDKKQGARIDLPGKALEYIRENDGIDCDNLVKLLAQNELHKRTTRLDYCFNVTENASVNELWNYCEAGLYTGRLKPVPGRKIPGTAGAETVYFGAEKSDFRVRAYDKGAEMGDLWMAFARVEAQFRGEYAQNAAIDSSRGIPLSTYARTKINASCGDVQLSWWKEALEGELGEVTQLRRKETKFMNRMAQLMQEITKKALENDEQLDYIEEEFLTKLAENIMVARARKVTRNLVDMNTVECNSKTYRINDDWTITELLTGQLK